MDALTLAIAIGSGTVVGYGSAAMMSASARKLLESKLEEREKADKKKSKELDEAEKARKSAEEKLDKAKTAAKEAKDELESQRKAADEAKSEVSALKKAKGTLEDEHKQALASLQAELEAAKQSAGGVSPELASGLEAAGKNLDDILTALVKNQELGAALLSDANGISIARAGDNDLCDSAAAAVSTITSLPEQLKIVVELDKSFQFRFQDGDNAVVGCTFQSAGELIGLTAIGKSAPSDAALSHTVDSLGAALK